MDCNVLACNFGTTSELPDDDDDYDYYY